MSEAASDRDDLSVFPARIGKLGLPVHFPEVATEDEVIVYLRLSIANNQVLQRLLDRVKR